MKIEVKNLEDLKKVVGCIKNTGKKIIILSGTLGSGKTTLVKEFVKSLGLRDEVTSPTFAIQNVYENKVYHYDLYNKALMNFWRSVCLKNLKKMAFISSNGVKVWKMY